MSSAASVAAVNTTTGSIGAFYKMSIFRISVFSHFFLRAISLASGLSRRRSRPQPPSSRFVYARMFSHPIRFFPLNGNEFVSKKNITLFLGLSLLSQTFSFVERHQYDTSLLVFNQRLPPPPLGRTADSSLSVNTHFAIVLHLLTNQHFSFVCVLVCCICACEYIRTYLYVYCVHARACVFV